MAYAFLLWLCETCFNKIFLLSLNNVIILMKSNNIEVFPLQEPTYRISWYDETTDGNRRNMIIASEERRNKMLQKLVDKGFSPTYRLLPENMTDQEKLELYNDTVKVFTLSTSVNEMKMTTLNTVDCVEHLVHPYVYGVEIILFNEFVSNEVHYPEQGVFETESFYPENVEELVYQEAIALLDSIGFDYERTKELYERGEFEIDNLLKNYLSDEKLIKSFT